MFTCPILGGGGSLIDDTDESTSQNIFNAVTGLNKIIITQNNAFNSAKVPYLATSAPKLDVTLTYKKYDKG